MFGIFRKKKFTATPLVDACEAAYDKSIFTSRVVEMRKKWGFPEAKLLLDELIVFFAMNLADVVFQRAKGKDIPESSADQAEKVAMLVIFTQSIHMGGRMSGVGINDKQIRLDLIFNGLEILLQNYSDSSTLIELANNTYGTMSDEHLDTLRQIDTLAHTYLVSESEDSLIKLVSCWRQIVKFINGNKNS